MAHDSGPSQAMAAFTSFIVHIRYIEPTPFHVPVLHALGRWTPNESHNTALSFNTISFVVRAELYT